MGWRLRRLGCHNYGAGKLRMMHACLHILSHFTQKEKHRFYKLYGKTKANTGNSEPSSVRGVKAREEATRFPMSNPSTLS